MTDDQSANPSPEELVEAALRCEGKRFDRDELLRTAHTKLTESSREEEAANLTPLILALSVFEKTTSADRFGPMMSGTKEDGTPWEFPDFSVLEAQDWNRIREAALSTAHPTVRARCADLLWVHLHEFPMVLVAFDAYLESAPGYYAQDWLPELVDALGRAVFLAASTHHDDWLTRAIAAVWDYVIRAQDDGDATTAKRVLDVLVDMGARIGPHVDFVEVLRHTQVITEAAISEGADESARRAHLELVREAAVLVKDAAAAESAGLEIVESFKREAAEREAAGSAMVAATFIEEALRWCEKCGADETATEALTVELQRLYVESDGEAHEFRHEGSIERAKLDAFLDPYRGRTPEEILAILTQDRNLIPSLIWCEETAREQMKQSPLRFLFNTQIFRANVKVREVSTEADHLDHAMRESASLHYQIAGATILEPLFDMLEAEHPEWPDAVNEFFDQAPWLQKWRLEILRTAIERVRAEDYVSAVHILVFWTEGCLRDFLYAAHVPVIKRRGVRLLKDLLTRLKQLSGVDHDLVYFLETLLASPLGSNLRNDVGHALAEPGTFSRKNALLVLLAAIRLGSYRLEPKDNEAG